MIVGCPVPNKDGEETCAKSSAKTKKGETARSDPTYPDPERPDMTPSPQPPADPRESAAV